MYMSCFTHDSAESKTPHERRKWVVNNTVHATGLGK